MSFGVATLALSLIVLGLSRLPIREASSESATEALAAADHPGVTWQSGASGPAVSDGTFATWRGNPVEIVGTWADNNEAMVGLWQLQPGGDLATWSGDMDVAVGAIGEGESWSAAAQGTYDARWRDSLSALARTRAGVPGVTYIRFAHESNGDWYPWRVTPANVEEFKQSWLRYRALQREIFPSAKLVFSVNRVSVNSGLDWRQSFPGATNVDALAVDYYNMTPFIMDREGWLNSLDDVDELGAPVGLGAHLAFARSVGLPLAVSEWSSDAARGDSPAFFEGMHEFFSQHGRDGDGALLYEIHFNVKHDDDNKWQLYPVTRMPRSAETYRRLW